MFPLYPFLGLPTDFILGTSHPKSVCHCSSDIKLRALWFFQSRRCEPLFRKWLLGILRGDGHVFSDF
jgi:hypothetical protein